jgi:K+-sensing histidine kinase KdpD
LERKLKLDKESAEAGFLTKVQDQIEKLNTLITDLLDVSKIENGKLKITKKPVNLGKRDQQRNRYNCADARKQSENQARRN